jgi:hypothetical protein
LVEIAPEDAPDNVVVAKAARVFPKGESVRIAVRDGWLLGS